MADVVYDAIFGATNIRQVRSSQLSQSVERNRARVSGSPYTSEFHVVSAEPVVNFTSGDLATAVTAMLASSTGLLVSGGAISIPYQKTAQGGTFRGTLAHTVLSATDGFAVIDSVSARHGDPQGAAVEIAAHLLSSDGETAPLTGAVDQTLAAQAFVATHSLGPVSLNGTQLEKVVSAAVNPGYTVQKFSYNGLPYPTEVRVASIDPTLTIEFEDFDALVTYGPLFSSLTAAAVHYRKRADGGTLVASGTPAHARFSVADSLAVNESASASAQENGSATIVIEGKTLTASGASAISL